MAVAQVTVNSTDINDNLAENLTVMDWWTGILEEDIANNALSLENSEISFWSGAFIPPPPRPLFLEETATTDGLTTCDLCTWAWKSKSFIVDAAKETPGEFGWVLTLIVVSIISATIGAVIMITVLHCRSRMKNNETSDNLQTNSESTRCVFHSSMPQSPNINPNKEPSTQDFNVNASKNGVWSWLTSRHSVAPTQLGSPTLPAENHYTHMNEAYAVVEDAMYAELNSNLDYNNPAQQNSAYTDPDASTSSAPSSAYYSDLSVSAMPDRTYEVIGVNNSYWEGQYQDNTNLPKQIPNKLTVISETCGMPSDYV